MNAFNRNRQPFLFMAAAIAISILSWLLLYRHAPEPSRPEDLVAAGEPEFKEAMNVTSIKADSFVVLLNQVYTTAKVERKDGKLQVALSGQGARTSDFYNDNPYLLKVKSNEFSIKHDHSKEEIAAIFTLHTEGKETYIRVPNDILFQLTEKAANAKHG
jgi:hypothetical protein